MTIIKAYTTEYYNFLNKKSKKELIDMFSLLGKELSTEKEKQSYLKETKHTLIQAMEIMELAVDKKE